MTDSRGVGTKGSRSFHDHVVWSLWCHFMDMGFMVAHEAAVPGGRTDIMFFSNRYTPCEILEVKTSYKTAIISGPQLFDYGQGLEAIGYIAPRLTLAIPHDIWQPELDAAVYPFGIRVRPMNFDSIRRDPPYRIKVTHPYWPANGWSDYWKFHGLLPVAA